MLFFMSFRPASVIRQGWRLTWYFYASKTNGYILTGTTVHYTGTSRRPVIPAKWPRRYGSRTADNGVYAADTVR